MKYQLLLPLTLLGWVITAVALFPATILAQEPPAGIEWRIYTMADGLPYNHTFAVAIDSTGAKWFATYDQVSRFDDQTWTIYTEAEGLPHLSKDESGHLTDIAVDRNDHIWVTTGDSGVAEFDGQSWRRYTGRDGLGDIRVYAVAVDAANNKWFGTFSSVNKFDGQTWTGYGYSERLLSTPICAIAVDAAGNVWAGSENGGVSRFDGQTWTTYTEADGLASNQACAVGTDPAGPVWVGTLYGVSRFDGQTWTTYNEKNGAPIGSNPSLARHVEAIAIDQAGQVWLATDQGVVKFTPDPASQATIEQKVEHPSWTVYTSTHGLASNWVNDVAVDAAGVKWFGTLAGVTRFDDHIQPPKGFRSLEELAGQTESELLAEGYISQTQIFSQAGTTYRAVIYHPADRVESTMAPNYLVISKEQDKTTTFLYGLREDMLLEFFEGHGKAAVGPGWVDMTGDGRPELAYLTWSGGNCWSCAQVRVLQLGADDRIIDLMRTLPPEDQLGRAFTLQNVRDLNGDGLMEWLVQDGRWEFAFGLCHACSPVGARVYAWDGQTYRNASAQFPDFYQADLDRSLVELEQLAASDVPWSGDKLGQMISLLLGYENIGRGPEGWAIFERLTDPAQYVDRTDAGPMRSLIEARELFRTWYEPAPASVIDYKLTLSKPTYDRNLVGSVHVMGTVTNDDQQPLAVSLIAGLYTREGKVLDAAVGALPVQVLAPGQSVPYDLAGFGFVDNAPSLLSPGLRSQVRVAYAVPAQIQPVALSTQHDTQEKVGRVWHFKGELVNSTGKTLAGSADVVVGIYAEDYLLATDATTVYGRQAGQIEPGEVIAYQIIMPLGLDPTHLTVKTYAQGYIHQ